LDDEQVCRHVLKRNLSFARLVILRTVSSAVLESETVYSSLKALSKRAAILSFDSSATDHVATCQYARPLKASLYVSRSLTQDDRRLLVVLDLRGERPPVDARKAVRTAELRVVWVLVGRKDGESDGNAASDLSAVGGGVHRTDRAASAATSGVTE
jgi:hypothetical protein